MVHLECRFNGAVFTDGNIRQQPYEWLKANVGPQCWFDQDLDRFSNRHGSFAPSGPLWGSYNIYGGDWRNTAVYLVFSRASDAVLFKMVWGEGVNVPYE